MSYCAVPGGPVVVGPVDDPEDTVVSLACLVRQGADLLQRVRHLRSGWDGTRPGPGNFIRRAVPGKR